jgi:hypothetical protein
MRDEIRWDAPLPAGHHSGSRLFRTNSFGEACEDHYVVTPAGRLLLVGNAWQDGPQFESSEGRGPVDVGFHGDIQLVSDDGSEYMARFTHGTLEWVRALADSEPWNSVAIARMNFMRSPDDELQHER